MRNATKGMQSPASLGVDGFLVLFLAAHVSPSALAPDAFIKPFLPSRTRTRYPEPRSYFPSITNQVEFQCRPPTPGTAGPKKPSSPSSAFLWVWSWYPPAGRAVDGGRKGKVNMPSLFLPPRGPGDGFADRCVTSAQSIERTDRHTRSRNSGAAEALPGLAEAVSHRGTSHRERGSSMEEGVPPKQERRMWWLIYSRS